MKKNHRVSKTSKKRKSERGEDYLIYLFEVSPFIIGISAIYSTLFFAAALSVALLILFSLRKEMHFFWNSSVWAGLLILIGGTISSIAGVDHGTGFEGLFILLSGAVFVLLLMQQPENEWQRALSTLPETGVVLVVVCAFLYLIPGARSFLFQSSRLNGLFQYANTMALYLLLCLTYFLLEEKRHSTFSRYFIPSVLFIGILWTGSRFTFLMTIVVFLCVILRRKVKRRLILVPVVILAAIVIATLVTGNASSFGRFLTISGHESTLYGRILYWADALPVILRHPLGLGYLGYSQVELSIQHGYYYVEFVHNEILQSFLDYGWIGGAGFLWLLIHNLRITKGTPRIMLLLMSIHMLFDFDLQFFPMIWMLLIFMNWREGREFSYTIESMKWKSRRIVSSASLSVFLLLALWIGLGDVLDYSGHPDFAEKIYPFDYKYSEAVMYAAPSYDAAGPLADRILKQNPYHSASYLLKANEAKSKDDIKSMLRYERTAWKLAPYRNDILNDYGQKLLYAINFAKKEENTAHEKSYTEELAGIPNQIQKIKASTNPLAYKIKDQPDFTLDKEVKKALEELR